jgi:hypothetical protein
MADGRVPGATPCSPVVSFSRRRGLRPNRRRSNAAAGATIVIALATCYAGVHWGSTVGGGADSFGYVSQAALWRSGHLSTQIPIVRPSPWPLAIDTWAPLGYRPAPGTADRIVPLYAPGLPLLMAAFQIAGGFCAAFLVVPVCGALTIGLTGVFARQLGASAAAALASVILMATSPIFLYQLMNPMSDVPATAAWTLAAVLLAGGWPLAGGFAASAALLIRPNLVALAAVLVLWAFAARREPFRFLLGGLPGPAVVAGINSALYGAPWVSGYGSTSDLYSVTYLGRNVQQFATWLFETQTPLVAIALLPLVVPPAASVPAVPRRRLLAAGVIAAVWLSYVFYIPFDAWWYLRFLLPAWPAMMALAALAGEYLLESMRHHSVTAGRWAAAAAIAVVAALAWNGVRVAAARSTFELGRGERRYVDLARFVASHTDPNAVMISLQHSGSLHLYAGRLTLRFDQLDPLWLDRAVAFLSDRGRHPFIVLEGGEIDMFRRRFAGTDVGRLDWPPVAALQERSFVYDAADRTGSRAPVAIAAAASRRVGWRCDQPYDARGRLRSE